MKEKRIFIGQTLLNQNNKEVKGQLLEMDGEEFYKIENYDEMPPFFMTIVSDSDHWMYLSSNGSLTAGRANPENAIFPYYTDDKIHDAAEITGSKSLLLVTVSEKTSLWEPFSNRYQGTYAVIRNLYKNTTGNKIVFDEVNPDLGLTFRYSWMNSDQFGWVRKSSLINISEQIVAVEVVDGLQNLLPYGVQRTMQGMLSTLLDAYKKCELVPETTLGLFRMSSIPVDRAEPSEALKATTVWSVGLPNVTCLLSNRQLDQFRKGADIHTETESLGIKGAYFVHANINLEPSKKQSWYMVAEVSQDASKVAELLHFLKNEKAIALQIEADVDKGTNNLINIVGKADGLEVTADQLNVKRHFANAMFNCMRGGVPFHDYSVLKSDFLRHISHFNKPLYYETELWLNQLPEELPYYELIERATNEGNADLVRLSLEYLPLMFSRRHGDPSRPWNLFDIKLKNADGSPSLYYQGNWRDIFQNWEALTLSYPAFLPGIIAKFLNATTIDGYNAYKITRDGIEWELMDPDDPWSNIGYWGDHQLIYLEKLLEQSEKFFPGKLDEWLNQDLFAYANVPYRHKPYQQLVAAPQDTIAFDEEKHLKIEKLVKEIGADGKLIQQNDNVLKVNLTEKLFVPLLSKLSNFVPGAGIWMNTQRPEWNDANNALVGNGASMVTLYYMRCYVHFLQSLFGNSSTTEWTISAEVFDFFDILKNTFLSNTAILEASISDANRKQLMDQLGEAGSAFREYIYHSISGSKVALKRSEVMEFLAIVQQFVDHSIGLNKGADGLYHAYNLLVFKENEVGVRTLPEMLEGQVALLSSGLLNAEETLALLDQLRISKLYRADQRSYTLYPNKQLPLFLEKNTFYEEEVNPTDLLKTLVADGNSAIIQRDIQGIYHFNGTLNNNQALLKALDGLDKTKYASLVEADKIYLLNLYEKLFDHQSFTGRSGSFYKYEGLGSIYWHMVSKLLLAVSEVISVAKEENINQSVVEKLIVHYNEIREGIGSHKSPAEYGAFPTDPYSHTPSMLGVQQPGMTGQVKEDLLSRLFELGVSIKNGTISFDFPKNLISELTINPNQETAKVFAKAFNLQWQEQTPFLAFSFCNVPVIYRASTMNKVVLALNDGTNVEFSENRLDKNWSRALFNRSGLIKMIAINFNH